MARRPKCLSILDGLVLFASAAVGIAIVIGIWRSMPSSSRGPHSAHIPTGASTKVAVPGLRPGYDPRNDAFDSSGFPTLISLVPNWEPDSSLAEISSV